MVKRVLLFGLVVASGMMHAQNLVDKDMAIAVVHSLFDKVQWSYDAEMIEQFLAMVQKNDLYDVDALKKIVRESLGITPKEKKDAVHKDKEKIGAHEVAQTILSRTPTARAHTRPAQQSFANKDKAVNENTLVTKDRADAIARELFQAMNYPYDQNIAGEAISRVYDRKEKLYRVNDLNTALLRRLQVAESQPGTSAQVADVQATRSHAAERNEHRHTKAPANHKVPGVDLDKIRVVSHSTMDALSRSEMQISLKDNHHVTHEMVSWEHAPFFNGVPALGHYQNLETHAKGQTVGDTYNFRTRLALLELDERSLSQLPTGLAEAVRQQVDLRNTTFDLNVVVHGRVINADQDSPNRTYNFVTHPWLSARVAQNGMINTDVLMGVFVPHGIAGGDIPYNHLAPRNVNVHGSDLPTYAFSPDNARFGIQPGRDIATFWSAAITPAKNAVMITFNIVLNSAAAEEAFAFRKTTFKLSDFIAGIERAAGQCAGADREALRNAARTIQDLIR